MKEIKRYDDAVKAIKTAILRSQYDAARSVNEKQLMLYYGIGKYISMNSRKGFWGKGAIDAISGQLSKELPGLRGFKASNLKAMRFFYEEWKALNTCFDIRENNNETDSISVFANTEIEAQYSIFKSFFQIGFTHHRVILIKVKDLSARLKKQTTCCI